MAVLPLPVLFKSASSPRTVLPFVKQPSWQTARAAGENAKQARRSGTRRKTRGNGRLLIGPLTQGITADLRLMSCFKFRFFISCFPLLFGPSVSSHHENSFPAFTFSFGKFWPVLQKSSRNRQNVASFAEASAAKEASNWEEAPMTQTTQQGSRVEVQVGASILGLSPSPIGVHSPA